MIDPENINLTGRGLRGARGPTGADGIEISGLVGVPAASTDMGDFTSPSVPDDTSVKGAIEGLAGVVDGINTDAARKSELASTSPGNGSDMVAHLGPGPDDIPRMALAKLRDTYSAKDAGALGDFAADDAAAIQSALDYAGTQVQNILTGVDLVTAAVYLPAGRYKTGAPLVIPEGVRLFSDGPGSAIIYPQHTGDAIQMGDDTRYYSNIEIEGVTVVGNWSGTPSYGTWTTTTSVGIRGERAIRNCKLTNCFVTRCTRNYAFYTTYGFHINGCYGIYAIENNLWSDSLTASSIKDCRFDWAEQDGILIDCTLSGPSATFGLTIQNSAVQINWKNGIHCIDAGSVLIKDCFLEANYREAVDGTTHACADIYFEDSGASTALVYEVTDCFFTSGSSPDVDAYTAIRCDKANTLVATGNSLRDSWYWRFVDANNPNVVNFDVHGNAISGTLNAIVAYDPTVARGIIQGSNTWGGSTFIPALAVGTVRYPQTVTGSNATTSEGVSTYLVDTAAGNRTVTLRTADAVGGRRYAIKKASADANTLTIQTEGGSGTIDGAATHVISAAYGHAVVEYSPVGWMIVG